MRSLEKLVGYDETDSSIMIYQVDRYTYISIYVL